MLSLLIALSLAAGPGSNCPAATQLGPMIDAGPQNIIDGGATFCDGGNFCDGGVPLYIVSTQSYFQVACNLNNPLSLNADPVQPNLYFTSEGTWDGGRFNDGLIYSLPIDGGALKPLSPATQACPISLTSDGTNVIWVNAGTNCSYTDAGAGGQNAIAEAPWDGGTNVVLVAGYQGIRKVTSDGTSAYFTTENQTGTNPAIGTVQAVLLDAGASYPVTVLWSSASGTAMYRGSICTWTNGIMSCPGLGISSQPAFNAANSIAQANGILYWGPSGMSMPTNGSAIPTLWGASFALPAKAIMPFDAGVLWQSGSGIVNGSGQPIATNADPYYGAATTDQTSVFFACNAQPNGNVSVCQTAAYQTSSYPVSIAGEFVGSAGSSSKSYTASAPPVKNVSFVLSLGSPSGSIPIAQDNDAGLLLATSNTVPSPLPTILDGGIVYSTGAAFVNLSGPIPQGYNLVAQYVGSTTSRSIPVQALLATAQPGISGLVVDSLGNLDWVSPTGVDAGSITMLQPK